jgi:putative FmdB family regulatory protein
MPIYEYRCPSCGAEFERKMKISDPNPPCPSCDAPEVRKLVSRSSFQLKGSGWYSDHYGLKSGGGGSSSGGGGE